jgi:hypothetical protein
MRQMTETQEVQRPLSGTPEEGEYKKADAQASAFLF